MKYLYIYCVICFLNVSVLSAQEASVVSRINAFQNYVSNHPVEKIYLHLDKPYYAAGEYMYFRAYLTDQDLNQDNAKSGIIYVELSDAKKNLVKRILLYSENHEFAGQIQIPDSLPPANYHLRAYTNYMRNAGEDYFYHRDIYIGNTSSPKQEVATAKAFDYQVSFFPEGGQLLRGLSCKVAFKSLGIDGFGTDITGTLFDSENKEILRFSSTHLGMGSFNFTPEKGKTYKVSVQSNGITKEYTLPAATEGLALSARQDDKSVFLTIHSTNDKPDSIYIIGQSRHTICYALNGYIENHEQQVQVDKAKFPTGIAQFTLFKDGKPVSERLVFIDRKDDLHISIIPDKESYGDREKATIQIKVTDKDGQPLVAGSFSLSVTDDRTVKPSFNEQNIKGNLLLAEDLKGYIESPGWYFAGDESERAEALDNLLCSQGWTRFVWDKLPAPADIYPAESEFQITGKVTNAIGRPVKAGSVILFSRENTPGTATTDENGRFGFYGFNCPDTAVFLLQCRTKRDNKTFIGFKLDSVNNKASINTFPLTFRENKNTDDLITSYTEQTGRLLKYRLINLPEVTITAKKIPDRESFGIDSYRFGGKIVNRPYPIKLLLQTLPSPGQGAIVSIFAMPHVVYDVDGDVMTIDEFTSFFGSWRADMFESVEILGPKDASAFYGLYYSGGAYRFKTKRFTGGSEIPDASIEVVRPEGYCVRKEFYIPAYDKPEVKSDPTPDLRTTIYWNPVVHTDKDGKAEVSFFTADNTGTYSYILEGIGDNKIAYIKK